MNNIIIATQNQLLPRTDRETRSACTLFLEITPSCEGYYAQLYSAPVKTVQEYSSLSPLRPGHAIGLDVIDFRSVTESNETILKPGMTVAMHPAVLRELGGEGVGMGYTYLITETGAEKLSKFDLHKLG